MKDSVVVSGDKKSGKATSSTRTVRQMVSDLAHRSGAGLTKAPATPEMSLQGQDWSRGMACVPQTFVRLVGYRDPDSRPSSPWPQRTVAVRKKMAPTDTPIG